MRIAILLVLSAGTAVAEPSACERRLEAAKAALIADGFHPTADRDTGKWLEVSGDADNTSMGVEMGGADSAHTGYWVSIERGPSKTTSDWRLRRRNLCCDDNHEESDHIVRFVWEKTTRHGVARIMLDRFGDDLKSSQHQADLFIATARRAAEDCLR